MSAQNETKPRDYSRYDHMSTAELERLLRLDFQASEEEASDLDSIFYISDLLAKRNGPSDPDAAWAQFQAKYRPYAHGSSLYDWGDEDTAPAPEAEQRPAPLPPARPRRIRRRLAVLAAVLAACLVGGMAAQAAGVDILSVLAHWTDETFRFAPAESRPPSGSQSKQEDMEQIQSSLQMWGMEEWFPTWHLEGFVPGDLQSTQLNASVSVHATFFGPDRTYSVVVQRFTQPDHNTGIFEKDSTPVEEYVHNGQVFYILSNIDSLTATTYNGEYMVMISGVLTRDEIKAIIDSIPGPQASSEREQLRARLAEEGQLLYCPQIPDGFVQTQSQFYTDPVTNEIFWSELYTRGEQNLVIGVIQHTGPSDTVYEKDSTPVETYEYHGITHYIFSNTGSTSAAWMVENTEYYIFATDGAVDMKELIRSAYELE